MEPQEALQNQTNTSSRDAIEAAINKLEGDEDGDTPRSRDTVPQPASESAGEGIQANTAPATDIAAAAAGAEAKAAGAGEFKDKKPVASLTDTPSQTQQRNVKAPVSWKPAVREVFNTLPAAVQDEVLRREREIQGSMQEAASSRQVLQRFGDTIAPYQQVIALEGGDPIKAFGDYLKTASVLRMGTPHEKAIAVAQAINTFGVDVTMLDGALAAVFGNKPMPNAPAGQQQQEFRDPRMDQFLETMQQREADNQARVEAELSEEIDTFASDPKNEFFEDLREDIGAILRVGVERGRVISLAEAYRTAVQLHPEISKVIQQRAEAARVNAGKPSLAAKRAAASGIVVSAPKQQGAIGGDKGPSTREAIEMAIDSLAG